jgi:hypothetical protein
MFDHLHNEIRMPTSLNAVVSATRDADRLAAAAHQRTAPASVSPRFGRVRAAWHARRAAPLHVRARAA